jgi:hypothetical protein
MTANRRSSRTHSSAAAPSKSKATRWPRLGLAVITGLTLLVVLAPTASAHGPIAPIASSYLARVGSAPPGLSAKVVDGDQRMWLQVRRGLTVLVLDYRGAPYLRFSSSVIAVNQNSAMY